MKVKLFLIFSLTLPQLVFGQEDLFDMSMEDLMKLKVTTIASGIETSVEKTASTVTVITRKEIDLMPANNVWDVLETIPGTLMTDDVDSASNKVFSIRGMYENFSDKVLLLMDGKRINSVFRGTFTTIINGGDLFPPLAIIDRIEIIRGPASALYGADALAGVVNIITKKAGSYTGTYSKLSSGTFQDTQIDLVHGGKYGKVNYFISANRFETNGHKEDYDRDAATINDDVYSTITSYAPGAANRERTTQFYKLDISYKDWRTTHMYGAVEGGFNMGVAQALMPTGKSFKTFQLHSIEHDWKIQENLQLKQTAFYRKSSNRIIESLMIFPPGSRVVTTTFMDGYIGNPQYWEEQYHYYADGKLKVNEALSINAGVGYFLGDLYKVQEAKNFGFSDNSDVTTIYNRGGVVVTDDTTDVFIAEEDRETLSAYLQSEIKWNKLTSTLGVRVDKFSDFGTTTNPRMAFVYEATEKLNFKALYGRAFKAPSFVALYSQANPVSIGNPDLKPEFINNYEFVTSYNFSEKLRLKLNLYYYSYKRGITRVNSVWSNSKNYAGGGGELEVWSRPLRDLEVQFYYAQAKIEDKTNNIKVERYPRHQWMLTTNWKISEMFTISNQLYYRAEQPRPNRSGKQPTQDFLQDNIAINANNFFWDMNAKLVVRNVFNTQAQEVNTLNATAAATGKEEISDHPRAGRHLMLEISRSF